MKRSFWYKRGFHPIFLATLPDFPWLLPEVNYRVYTFFLSLNSRSFKEVLLMIYVHHNTAAFTFAASSFTPTYDARWMCLNVTHSWMNMVGSIDLSNSRQTLSIRIVWQLRTAKGILVLTPHKGRKM